MVLCYAYLWHTEAEQGRDEGVKDRPCAIVLTSEDADGETLVTVVPITHRRPDNPDKAVAIPAATKLRLGLDGEPAWVVISETNTFAWPGPDLRPVSREVPDNFVYGVLPPSLFAKVRDKLTEHYRRRWHRGVRRTE